MLFTFKALKSKTEFRHLLWTVLGTIALGLLAFGRDFSAFEFSLRTRVPALEESAKDHEIRLRKYEADHKVEFDKIQGDFREILRRLPRRGEEKNDK